MNLLLLIALSGNVYRPTEPTIDCSKVEPAKCSEAKFGEAETLEEELNRGCRQIRCMLNIYNKCGITVFQRPVFPVKGNQRFVDAFCSDSSPLRTKFIENFRCIMHTIERNDSKDYKKQLMMCGYKDVLRDEYCRMIPGVFNCTVDFFTRNCGKDAGEVFGIAGLTLLDDYDCLSS